MGPVSMIETIGGDSRPFDWDLLLREIENGRVIPIVGPELLPYHQSLATPLAQALGLDHQDGTHGIVGVADEYIRSRSDNQHVSELRGLLEASVPLPIPEPIQQLAAITQFRLILTTDYSSFIERALDALDPSKRTGWERRVFVPRDADEFETYPTKGKRVVYHLLGHLDRTEPVALAHVDQLESLYALRGEDGAAGLLNVLASKRNLLFLGCDFPEWLAGIFTRTLLGKPLYESRDRGIEVVANRVARSQALTAFLRNNRLFFCDTDPVRFVDELFKRYTRRAESKPLNGGGSNGGGKVNGAVNPALNGSTGRAGHTFLSYMRHAKGTIRTRALRDHLISKGIDAWLDETDVAPGDQFAQSIRLAIENEAAAFIPILTFDTLDDASQGFFFREWNWAVDVMKQRPADAKFVFPVIVDGTSRDQIVELLRRRFPLFAEVNIIRCPDGELSDDSLVEVLIEAKKRYERRRMGRNRG